MKWLKWIGLSIAAMLALSVATAAWMLTTQSGARWTAGLARNVLGGKLALGEIEGTIAGPLSLRDVRYRDDAAGIDLRVKRISIDMALQDVVRAAVHVKSAELSGIDVLLKEPTQPPPPRQSRPFSLEPPVDVIVDSLLVDDLAIRRGELVLFDAIGAAFSGHWTEADLAVQRLDLRSSKGQVHFSGSVAQRRTYAGEGHGRFRWTVADRTYAGTIDTLAKGNDVNLTLWMASPLNARLDASAEQSATWPWRFTLEAPRFDPREELMPDSRLHSLGASLRGHGSLEQGAVSGTLLVNGQPLHIDPLRFERDPKRLSLDAALRIGDAPGEFRARADVDLAREPIAAKVAANWDEMTIPAVWAGQDLLTRGKLDFEGGSQRYRAAGAVALGPAGRVADIVLEVRGSPDAIALDQFDIVQKTGRLAASGAIDLKPRIGWRVAARGKDFDPGAFAAAWRGRLGFQLASEGRMMEGGPSARLQLTGLRGELRGRAVAGNADLSLTPALVPAGTLSLDSGNSKLRFRGKRGDRVDATLSLDIASLEDWLPDSDGELRAGFHVRGRWPELSIDGEAQGKGLQTAGVLIDALALTAEVDNPRSPEGRLRLDLTGLTAGGFDFESVQARLAGALDAHRFELRATSQPLALDVALQGGRTRDGWSGSLQSLVFDIRDAARLALREPARIVLGKGAVDVSRACLVDGRIELCAAGGVQPNGSMQASYSLANVPLALANVVSSDDLPLRFAGMIQGRGEVRRSAEGELHGNVLIESPSGRVSRYVTETPGGDTAEEPQTLFSYEDLRLAADLSGSDARGSLSARIENGSLRGEATVRGLDQAQTPVTARVSADIPDLAPLAVFAPQLANVHGRADAQLSLAGTLQEPEISGQVAAHDLAAEIPAIGLRLKNGRLQARPVSASRIEIAGGIESGDGRIELAGSASLSGAIDLNISGDRFLAADIPGARVIVTPDLDFTRAEERMTLTGKVTIPEAAVNLQKLPRGDRAPSASPDVVVIDAKTREQEAEAAPLFAEISVVLGDKVELTGFGLQAQVKGRLDVRETPGEPTVGSGEVRVSGKYKAYGQDLTIRQGQLLYAATPLDNPRLNIEATRTVEEVTAGLRIRGSAQSPELTIFSDPPMAQSDALAYIVTGKPLEDIGADEAESDAMQSAARSLGAAAGGLLAKNVGRRLGVDEVAVKEEEMIGGAALTVGQYLSPRLFLSYGIGLFEPGEVVTLRYKLSDKLAVQTQTGPEDTRAGIEYRTEK